MTEKEINELAEEYALKFVPHFRKAAAYAFFEGFLAAQEKINEKLREL